MSAQFALLEFIFFNGEVFWGLFLSGFVHIWEFHLRSGAVFALPALRLSWLQEFLSARGFEPQGWSCQEKAPLAGSQLVLVVYSVPLSWFLVLREGKGHGGAGRGDLSCNEDALPSSAGFAWGR